MAKDPAFLFYSNDFLSGTFTMSHEEVGKYIRLLCLQHQKTQLSKKDMLSICKAQDKHVWSKFIEKDGFYYNERLRDEAIKRAKYSESRKRNGESKKKKEKSTKAYAPHMEDVNENIYSIIYSKILKIFESFPIDKQRGKEVVISNCIGEVSTLEIFAILESAFENMKKSISDNKYFPMTDNFFKNWRNYIPETKQKQKGVIYLDKD